MVERLTCLQWPQQRDNFKRMLASDTLICNRYLIVRPIGEGGMGAVYEALDQRLRSRVALKQTLVSGASYTGAFEHEAQLLANLRHAALPKVSDYFTDPTGQFLVMEYIPGDDLGALLARTGRPFPFNTVAHWADLLLDALEYLHTQPQPIIHRDIKPQNLKLTPRGEVILLDFGLAKGSWGVQSQIQPLQSVFGYTPQYAPLEQIEGAGTDARSDLYSLGATLYHLMTNTMPPSAVTRATEVLNGRLDPLRPAHELNSEVPPAISGWLMQAMAIESRRRFASAAAMRAALRASVELPPTRQAPPMMHTPPMTHTNAAEITNPVTASPTAPRGGANTAYSQHVQDVPTHPPTWQQQPQQAMYQPASVAPARRSRALWWIAGIVLVLIVLGVAAVWWLTVFSKKHGSAGPFAGTPTATSGATSGTNKTTSASGATYPVMLANGGKARVKDDIYQILSAQLDRYSSDKLVMRLVVRLQHNADSSINYWSDSFRLVVDGTPTAPSKGPNLVVSPYATMDAPVEFVVPQGTTNVVLQVGQVGSETNDIPIDLSARSTAPDAVKAGDAFQGTNFPVDLPGNNKDIHAGDGVYKLLSVHLDRYSSDQISVQFEVRFTNKAGYDTNLWADSFRVLIDGVPYAPVKAPNLVVGSQKDEKTTVDFAIPDTVTNIELQVGQVGKQVATIPINLKP